MNFFENVWDNEKLVETLENGGVVIMPTDTIYGMLGKAEDQSVVERIYAIRKRNPTKPCIVLIGDISELEKFSVSLTDEQKNKLKEYWFFEKTENKQLRATSIIFDCKDERFAYLHRGTKTLAFRLPTNKELRDLLLKTGPLIAPSANQESYPPHDTIEEAQKYFGDAVDLYIDGGEIFAKSSQIIKLHNDGSVSIIRE